MTKSSDGESENNNQVNTVVVQDEDDKTRLDSFLVRHFGQYSRAKIQRAINKGHASINGKACKSSFRLSPGQQVTFQLPPVQTDAPIPEDIPLDVIYEDDHLIGINKPPRMVVHPAKGHWSGTLTAALAFHFEQLSSVGGPTRPGIVHRLDRDTSGIIIVAKTDQAHARLSKQFETRTVTKKYVAFVAPRPDRDRDHIEQPIGAHPYQREKMAIRADHKTSRNASTFYEVLETAGRFAKLLVSPKTGRTHQIRVHLAHVRSPVLADKLYGGRSQFKESDIIRTGSEEVILDRQALHAASITFRHPETDAPLTLEAPLADDLEQTWQKISELFEK